MGKKYIPTIRVSECADMPDCLKKYHNMMKGKHRLGEDLAIILNFLDLLFFDGEADDIRQVSGACAYFSSNHRFMEGFRSVIFSPMAAAQTSVLASDSEVKEKIKEEPKEEELLPVDEVIRHNSFDEFSDSDLEALGLK